MDFKDFCEQKITDSEKIKSRIVKENLENVDEERMQGINDTIKNYQNMSQDDRMSELFKKVNDLKSSGKFDKSQIERFEQMLKPMLTEEQSKKMHELINMI